MEDFSQLLQVLIKVLAINDDIVQADQTCLPLQPSQSKFHKPLEGSWSIAETKRHYLEFKEAMAGRECCLLTVNDVYLDLPITTSQIQGCEHLNSSQRI